ncbi:MULTISPECIES: NAD(P)H-dependent glycerol-3-phosphate dehydrogenase [Eubacteriales]|uniref:Glycerol-3-phosphate dehydrogenase [NAD(P)+] n=1 Tax=Bittarella massiliensis (ex Durand et al. 2017) TaxID=1720313 RepID=A0AAQ1MBE8_9FIRM|nr:MULTISPECIES: NAD(P)H-dependent glycerol-3-phosphate dehydrogenase [Eubacteriales]ERJ00053.1 glycerol-3-phosphate dehydrogenase [NAD(P)+ ] [Clostridium sp. ATCC 29733]MZL68691.1 NAD(P)H-dependent glycerol-3-phosphate dehydrogenase [Bittarella massiliensis (ex Durand et al. 2017)]MZL79254.1 NAD(P)H-dependent glycerol-3-phosphate dehydrogenase [Bittarella massiliensis (ex Durand et al. 2017)]SHF69037.1 glycerol 3-phosphate dehydrogenase (NAD(P)+) [Bittarella massiliensis (ex Durand et al. 2017
MAKIVILGAGGFGISLAVMARSYGNEVTLWSPFQEEVDLLTYERENKKLLPGVVLEPDVGVSTDIAVAEGAQLLLFAVPSQAVRSTAQKVAPHVPEGAVLANVAKGLENGTQLRLTQVIESEIGGHQVVALSGPSHAEEVARGVPTTIVAACKVRANAEYVQTVLMNPNLRIYLNDDVVGVELGGALKNVIALAAGISDGLKLGDNAKAALMTRGLSEIARLGVAMGGRSETFAGLTGVGDLIVTCTSMHSRNRRCGLLIGQGMAATDALKQIGMTVEGYTATLVARELSLQAGVEMPIVEQMFQVLYNGLDCRQGIKNLMSRPRKHESEQVWFGE